MYSDKRPELVDPSGLFLQSHQELRLDALNGSLKGRQSHTDSSLCLTKLPIHVVVLLSHTIQLNLLPL